MAKRPPEGSIRSSQVRFGRVGSGVRETHAPSQEMRVDWRTSVRSDELFRRPSFRVCAPSFVSALQPRFTVSIDADTLCTGMRVLYSRVECSTHLLLVIILFWSLYYVHTQSMLLLTL